MDDDDSANTQPRAWLGRPFATPPHWDSPGPSDWRLVGELNEGRDPPDWRLDGEPNTSRDPPDWLLDDELNKG